jgi:hypothetical protein
MTAPIIPPSASLATVRDDLVFTKTLLIAEKLTSQAKAIDGLLKDWGVIQSRQYALWDEITQAEALVAAADNALDDFIVSHSATIDAETGKGKSSPVRALYFKVAPYELAAPVLGDELREMKRWQKLLSKEKLPRVSAGKKRLDALVKDADAAVKRRQDAEAENATFRATGDLASFFTKVQSTRDGVAADLDAMASKDESLPRGYGARFFRHRTIKVSVEEKQARAAKKEADRKAKADAQLKVQAARAKVKAALQELKAAAQGK